MSILSSLAGFLSAITIQTHSGAPTRSRSILVSVRTSARFTPYSTWLAKASAIRGVNESASAIDECTDHGILGLHATHALSYVDALNVAIRMGGAGADAEGGTPKASDEAA